MTGISYRTTAQDPGSRALEVTVDADRLQAAENEAVREYARRARLPGFRKGHTPEPVIRRRFDSEIRQRVIETALRESWTTILKDADLKPTADPQVRNVSWEAGKPLTFELLVEVRPEISLATTGGFTVSRKVEAVTDAMVDEQMQHLREERATWSPVADGHPKPGHLVSITATPIPESGEPKPGQPHDVVLGQNQALPELEDRIMQLAPGETIDSEVRFPEDHPDAERRGKTQRVRVTLHGIKEQILPPLDDALARELGDFDTVDALRDKVTEDLVRNANRDADDAVRGELIRQIADANQVPAPPSLVHRLFHSYAESYRIPADQFESFAKSFQPVVEAQVRRELILDALATAQNLRATEADVDARVATLAAARGVEPGKLYTSLQQNNRLADIERSLTEEKVFAWLLAQSTVTEDAA